MGWRCLQLEGHASTCDLVQRKRVFCMLSSGLQVGHAGTLDPMATGLLIVCTGRATKRIDAFVAMRKEYSGVLRLGQATPSYDAETEPEPEQELRWEHISGEAAHTACLQCIVELDMLSLHGMRNAGWALPQPRQWTVPIPLQILEPTACSWGLHR